MRRVSIVSGLAAVVVIGHLGYHLVQRLAPSPRVTEARVEAPPPTVPPAVIEAAAEEAAPDPASTPCRLQPPLTEADRKPMLDALRPLVARIDRRYPYLARDHREFVRRFETCGVDVREFNDYVLVATAFGGYWTGARFRKTPHGWIALQTEGGDIR